MSEIPIYGARDLVGANLDMAVHEVAPNENFMWEISTVMMGTPNGPHPQSLVILTGPSPILGTGSLIATAGVDLRDMLQVENATRVIRDMANYLREMRTNMLAEGNGKFQLPGQPG